MPDDGKLCCPDGGKGAESVIKSDQKGRIRPVCKGRMESSLSSGVFSGNVFSRSGHRKDCARNISGNGNINVEIG